MNDKKDGQDLEDALERIPEAVDTPTKEQAKASLLVKRVANRIATINRLGQKREIRLWELLDEKVVENLKDKGYVVTEIKSGTTGNTVAQRITWGEDAES